MRNLLIGGLMALAVLAQPCPGITLDLGTAKLNLDDRGVVTGLEFPGRTHWPASGRTAFALQTDRGTVPAKSVRLEGTRLHVLFEDGSTAEFTVSVRPGIVLFRMNRLLPRASVQHFRLFSLPVPKEARLLGTLNGAQSGQLVAAVMAAQPNVNALSSQAGGTQGDRPGCRHEFLPCDQAKVGRRAARFTASCNEVPGGWSVRGMNFIRPLDLSGCKALRAWVNGDGKGEALKIQLFDGQGGYRDNYLTIDFKGWRQVTLTDCPINTLRYDRVAALNFYYNSMPASQTVSCLIDQVEALCDQNGKEQVVLLEDFESSASPLFSPAGLELTVETVAQHGLEPADFGVIACPRGNLWDTIQRFEQLAGLPSPRLGGVWNKQSPWIQRSYFFLTDFRQSQFEEALAIARRGGFHMILLGQESWCRSTGHFDIDTERFPQGLEGLRKTIQRFKDAGFRVGLHFLGPSIYPPDPYLTPAPDPRLVKAATTTLGRDVDAKADFLPTPVAPEKFPAEDGGYEGEGTVLQVGEELIWYGARSLQPPFGFRQCRRGHLGTKAAAHRTGDKVSHLLRSYGYHMFDMDTGLLDEVAGNFARVANSCAIDMIYFDGSERLQGDHWYYNARLHKAFWDKLANKDLLLQASSYSHFSWHLLARSASADGHGDLKGYLDERSPWFDSLARDGMPLDIGWYYGYDSNQPLDMYEYVLGATIGYDASMSFQVSVAAARAHPFSGAILDLIGRYEKLRLSGRVPDSMKARLRIDSALGGQKKPEERAPLLGRRREYRLLGPERREVFQRVVYDGWQEVASPGEIPRHWIVALPQGPARVGFQIHLRPGPWLAPGAAYRAADALVLETFDDLAPYTSDPRSRKDVRQLRPEEVRGVSAGVTQRVELAEGGPEGRRHALYHATSTRPTAEGWSVFGRQFDPPLDLSWHAGLGFWLRGDGKGGLFKLQLGDGKGATDYYIANDYRGWRYHQLARPKPDPIDYRRVRSLLFYYNGLPARTSISCGIDDVKVLRRLDRKTLTDPWIQIGDQRLAWKGTLGEGEYLVYWPGEPVRRYAPGLSHPEESGRPGEVPPLPSGKHEAQFGLAGELLGPIRVRLTFELPEKHEVPGGKGG